jgi:putative toxin-antitoxin system antitoxin component (TIGR02293 family)
MWLNSPNMALSWRAPLKLAETEQGARLVEDLIGRLEHGVYS